MEKEKGENPDRSVGSYTSRGFLKRVFITFAVVITITVAAVLIFIYIPLNNELEKSLIDNFNQLSIIRYHSLKNNIDRSEEGARSLSSRSMIKTAMEDFNKGEMSFYQLREFVQPKYEDGVMALENLVFAERLVDEGTIALFVAENYGEDFCSKEGYFIDNNGPKRLFCLENGSFYYEILSPVVSEKQMIGYDKLVFDLTEEVHLLSTDKIKSKMLKGTEYEELRGGSRIVDDKEFTVLYKEGYYHHVVPMENDIFFVTRQEKSSLMAPALCIGKNLLISGIIILFIVIAIIHLSVVYYADRKLTDMEKRHGVLKQALSESNMDPLTRVGGRRMGEQSLNIAFENFRRTAVSPAILLFDIDSLKVVNDTYGHSVGDDVIRSVVQTIHSSIYKGDTLFRWGGDEFIGIIEGLDKKDCRDFTQKLLNATSSLAIKAGANTLSPTISLGITYFFDGDLSYIDAINRADRAMYKSKFEGKNKATKI